MVKREEVKQMRWKLRYCTKMLQKQRASGYWDQTAPKVTRKREAKCVTESEGESERVSILPRQQMQWLLLLFWCMEVGWCRVTTRMWAKRIWVKAMIPGQPAWRRCNQIFETLPPLWFPPHRIPPVLSLVYTVTSAKHRRAGVATMRRTALRYDELRCERRGMITWRWY